MLVWIVPVFWITNQLSFRIWEIEVWGWGIRQTLTAFVGLTISLVVGIVTGFVGLTAGTRVEKGSLLRNIGVVNAIITVMVSYILIFYAGMHGMWRDAVFSWGLGLAIAISAVAIGIVACVLFIKGAHKNNRIFMNLQNSAAVTLMHAPGKGLLNAAGWLFIAVFTIEILFWIWNWIFMGMNPPINPMSYVLPGIIGALGVFSVMYAKNVQNATKLITCGLAYYVVNFVLLVAPIIILRLPLGAINIIQILRALLGHGMGNINQLRFRYWSGFYQLVFFATLALSALSFVLFFVGAYKNKRAFEASQKNNP